jgi:hypothetical protein
MTRWEYSTRVVLRDDLNKTWLDARGAEGWRVCGVVKRSHARREIVFVREIEDE